MPETDRQREKEGGRDAVLRSIKAQAHSIGPCLLAWSILFFLLLFDVARGTGREGGNEPDLD